MYSVVIRNALIPCIVVLEGHISIVMLSISQSFIMMTVFMLSAVLLNYIMLSADILGVV